MKRLQIFLLIILAAVITSGFMMCSEKENNFMKDWKKVDQLAKKGLPKSALKIVDSIYLVSKQNNNTPQVLKSLIYRVSLQSQFEENDLAHAITIFEQELKDADVPEKQLLQSLLAEMYQQYYRQNRWVINDRTALAEPDDEDISTWDAVRLNKKIRAYYLASLEEPEKLQNIRLEKYQAILKTDDKGDNGFKFWPTLYDLLANRAIDYFSGNDAGLSKIGNDGFISDKYLVPLKDFLRLKPGEENMELKLFRRLLKFHLKQKNNIALIDLDLRRLKYVYGHLPQNERNRENYITQLETLSKKYRDYPVFVDIAYELATIYRQSGNNYNPLAGDQHRWDLNKADSICDVAAEAFPSAEKANACKNMMDEIRQVAFNLNINKAELPGKPVLASLSFRNTTKLYVKIIEADPDVYRRQSLLANGKHRAMDYVKQKAVHQWEVDLPDTKDHQQHTTEIKIPAMEKGFYLVFISDTPEFKDTGNVEYNTFWVSRLSYLTRNDRNREDFEMYVLDRENGNPVPGVEVKTYQKVYHPRDREYTIEQLNKYKTDQNGYLKIEASSGEGMRSFMFSLDKEGDKLFSEGRAHIYRNNITEKYLTKTYLFTDRAIYRPGQTIYFKGIVVDKKGNDVKIKTGIKETLRLMAANYKEISKIELKTNEYGSFSGSFVLPQGGLNGRMTIRSQTGSVSFMVEEYKRPTYRVAFDTIKNTYKLGDTISVPGHAETYTGNAVSGAEVKYRVVQRIMEIPYYRYFFYVPHFAEREIANGKVITGLDGHFTISFPTEKEQKATNGFQPNYSFSVYVDVTDLTGEVQSKETQVYAGPVSTLLTINSKDKIHKEKTKGIEINATNLSGAGIDMETNVKVYRLTPPEHPLVKKNWNRPDIYLIPEEEYRKEFPYLAYKDENNKSSWQRQEVYSGQWHIKGDSTVLAGQLKTWSPGEYLIVLQNVSDTLVKAEQYFTLYSTETKKLPVKDLFWSSTTAVKAEPGDVVQIVFGSAGKKTKVLYELVNGKEIVHREWITVSRGQKVLDIPVKEAYRGGFAVHLKTVRQNRNFGSDYHIDVPFTNKRLDITLETHRDFLSPGKKETWNVKVSGPGGEKLAAELLAGMYDVSLDKFNANKWNWNLYQSKRNLTGWNTGTFDASLSFQLFRQKPEYRDVTVRTYPAVNWFGYLQSYWGGVDLLKRSMSGMTEVEGYAAPAMEDAVPDENQAENTPPAGHDKPEDQEQPKEQETLIPLRTNFNETAFFYPQLHTDSAGNVVFSFTTPDALTEWKLMMLAHTKDLKTGTFTENIKAKKDLMVIPNLPRFVRQGDRLLFTAKVINYTDKQITAETNLELFDPVTMKTVEIISPQDSKSQTVSISAGQSAVVQWELDIPFDLGMLGYRLEASTASFTDGEERMIPVLTNKMLVTETLPMYLKGHQSRQFTLSKLANSDKLMRPVTWQNYQFTVEFTSNPAWYAIQALPYLSEPEVESAANLFHMYYADVLSAYILNSNPKIKNVFESWKTHTPDAFLSNLQKNQELKKVVLKVTPWVLEAENEAEQKRRIGVMFDVNRISNQTDIALDKLRQSQLSNGAWPWFRGMREDRFTTQRIVLGLARLNQRQIIDMGTDHQVMQMVRKAVNFLDEEIKSDYEKVKKYYPNKIGDNHLGSMQIQYLYARILLADKVPVKDNFKEAYDYYMNQAKKYWLKQNNYLQAMIALTLNRAGYRNEAEGIIRSLTERAIRSDELGMYWKTKSGWYWYQAPVESQAMIIEAYSEIVNEPALVDQMKIWLLKQKQTTRWQTSSATAEAVYALLMTDGRLLDNNEEVMIKVGGQELHPGQENISVEAGTGYFKKSWSGEEVKPEMGRIEAVNPNTSIAWGAAYWQYFEQLDRITAASSPLSVEKKLFLETLTENGPVLVPVKEGQSLKKGDKIVSRMIITTDRDMEFVQVNDMRASAFEPVNNLSGYQYKGGLGYYENITDVSTDFYIRYLHKGTYVLEYPVVVTQSGTFSNGIATIQSYYAPEFAAHSEGISISVK